MFEHFKWLNFETLNHANVKFHFSIIKLGSLGIISWLGTGLKKLPKIKKCDILNYYDKYIRGVQDHFCHIETETETFGCWYRKSRLRLLVVGIKSWVWDFSLLYQILRLRLFKLVSKIETETETWNLWSQSLRPTKSRYQDHVQERHIVLLM